MPREIKPFDTTRKPQNPNPFWMLVEWAATAIYTIPVGGKIRKHNCEGLKPPYLFLSNHAAEIDFPMAVKANFPHGSNWVISIEEFVGREGLFRAIGGIYKRKFTSDLCVVKHILTVLKTRKKILVMYPEARYSLAGVNEPLDSALGQLVKTAKCPVVVMIEHGNFLWAPQWNKKPEKILPVSADMTQIVTAEEAATLSAEEIQKRIEDAFVYDDYQWQKDHNIRVKSKKRAQNIHRILYQCPSCKTEFSTESKGTEIWCNHCGKHWEMDELGELHCTNGEDIFRHVPDWYRWEHENVRKEVFDGTYHFEDTVRLEHLDNCKVGFRAIGNVKMTQDEDGIHLDGILNDGSDFHFHRAVKSMYSIHIEYNFHGRGDGMDLATLKDTYFAFPLTAKNVLTKIHFATIELYNKLKAEEK